MFSDAMDQPGNQQLVHELPKEVADWRQRWRNLYHPAPRGLFHYTDAAGLEGIIKSGCL
jgi:hypothetical protein